MFETLLYASENQDNQEWTKHFMVTYLMNVTNLTECLLMTFFVLCGTFLGMIVYIDYKRIKNINVQREQERKDILKIKHLLLFNIITQTLSYITEIIGMGLFEHCETNLYFIIPIFYLIFILCYTVSLYLCCWKSILIWGKLLCLKKGFKMLDSILQWLQKVPLFEIILSLLNLLILIFYFFSDNRMPNLIVSIINIILLIIFMIISTLFINYILKQKDIPKFTRKRMPIRITAVAIAFFLRLIWNITFFFGAQILDYIKCKDGKCDNCNQSDRKYWSVYLFFYFFISNLIPVALFNNIYTIRNQGKKIVKLINEDI